MKFVEEKTGFNFSETNTYINHSKLTQRFIHSYMFVSRKSRETIRCAFFICGNDAQRNLCVKDSQAEEPLS